MLCIVFADRPHGTCERTFLEKSENAALAFSCRQWISILCVSMTPWPHPSTPSLRPLNPAMSHNNNNNNNNGGLHACIRAAEDIEPIGQNILLLCHYAEQKRIVDNRIRHIVFFLLCLVSPSTVCLYTVHKLYAHAPSLLQVPPIGLEYELQRVESFTMDPFGRKYFWNDAEEDGGTKIVLVRVDKTSVLRLQVYLCSLFKTT